MNKKNNAYSVVAASCVIKSSVATVKLCLMPQMINYQLTYADIILS